MFGIGLPEMIVIFAVALIVVGPDKLPGLARSLAKGLMEMKKTLNQVKENLTQEGEALDSVHKDLRKTADELQEKMIDADPSAWHRAAGPATQVKEGEIIDVEPITVTGPEESDGKEAPAVEGPATGSETGEPPQAAAPQDEPKKAVSETTP
jgi:sec-independent protein translocase protein TatB